MLLPCDNDRLERIHVETLAYRPDFGWNTENRKENRQPALSRPRHARAIVRFRRPQDEPPRFPMHPAPHALLDPGRHHLTDERRRRASHVSYDPQGPEVIKTLSRMKAATPGAKPSRRSRLGMGRSHWKTPDGAPTEPWPGVRMPRTVGPGWYPTTHCGTVCPHVMNPLATRAPRPFLT